MIRYNQYDTVACNSITLGMYDTDMLRLHYEKIVNYRSSHTAHIHMVFIVELYYADDWYWVLACCTHGTEVAALVLHKKEHATRVLLYTSSRQLSTLTTHVAATYRQYYY